MLSFLFALACTPDEEPKESVADTEPTATDADGDGYVTNAEGGTDCDDGNASINPAAQEVCDETGIDENCDGQAEAPATYYGDADRDGYGDDNSTTQSCNTPPDSAFTGGDCDDNNEFVNPSAQEVCDADNVDEDCDGLSDDADDSVEEAGKTNYFLDSDLDGFGSDDAVIRYCDVQPGAVTNTDDCEDGDASVNPDGTEVLCDGVDQDCDGRDVCDATVYTTNLQNAVVVQPAGVGPVLATYLPENLLLVVADQGATLSWTAINADSNNAPTCDLGTFSSDWSAAPAFSGGPMDVSIAGLSAEGLVVDGVFASDMSGFKDGHALWDQDMRGGMEQLVGFPADEICALIVSFGASCHACQDGQPYCVTMEIEQVEGTQFSRPVSETGTVCSSCSVIPFEAAWGSVVVGLLVARLRRR